MGEAGGVSRARGYQKGWRSHPGAHLVRMGIAWESQGCVVVEEGAMAGLERGVAGEVGRLWGLRKKGG